MNLITTFALGLIFIVWTTSAGKSRTKRSLKDFEKMMECGTGRSAFDYNNYACHCGKGAGGRTLDKVDKCCRAHNNCYANLVATRACNSNKWLIATPYKRHACIVCGPGNGRCGKGLCDCDSTAVKCFKASPYNPALKKSGFKISAFRRKNCFNNGTSTLHGTFTTPVVPQTTIPGAVGYTGLGCYDENPGRDLPVRLFLGRERIDWQNYRAYLANLVQRCALAAHQAGKPYFGIQSYGECWAGDTFGKHGSGANECEDGGFQPCSGGGKLCTGTGWANYVYSTY